MNLKLSHRVLLLQSVEVLDGLLSCARRQPFTMMLQGIRQVLESVEFSRRLLWSLEAVVPTSNERFQTSRLLSSVSFPLTSK